MTIQVEVTARVRWWVRPLIRLVTVCFEAAVWFITRFGVIAEMKK